MKSGHHTGFDALVADADRAAQLDLIAVEAFRAAEARALGAPPPPGRPTLFLSSQNDAAVRSFLELREGAAAEHGFERRDATAPLRSPQLDAATICDFLGGGAGVGGAPPPAPPPRVGGSPRALPALVG